MFTNDEIRNQNLDSLGVSCRIDEDNLGAICRIRMETKGKSEGEFALRGLLRAIKAGRITFRTMRTSNQETYLLAINPTATFLDEKLVAIPIPQTKLREFKLFSQHREHYKSKKFHLADFSVAFGVSFDIQVS